MLTLPAEVFGVLVIAQLGQLSLDIPTFGSGAL